MSRRKFDKQAKQMAVASLAAGKSIIDVAQAAGVTPHVLRRWRRELSRFGDAAFPGNGRNRLDRKQRTQSLVFRLSGEEYERVQSAYRASTAHSLSEFARAQVFDSRSHDWLAQLEQTVQRLTDAVRSMSTRRAPAQEHIV